MFSDHSSLSLTSRIFFINFYYILSLFYLVFSSVFFCSVYRFLFRWICDFKHFAGNWKETNPFLVVVALKKHINGQGVFCRYSSSGEGFWVSVFTFASARSIKTENKRKGFLLISYLQSVFTMPKENVRQRTWRGEWYGTLNTKHV